MTTVSIGFAFVLAVCTARTCAQTSAVRETAQAFLNEQVVSGVIAVEQAGERLVVEAGGMADRRFGVLIDRHARFRIGSVTKLMASSLATRLIKRGTVGLDDRVIDWLPELSGRISSDATVSQLLEHTSGIDGAQNYPLDWRRMVEHADEPAADVVLRSVTGQLFEPGSRMAYSSVGTDLLGVIIERATDQTFAECLRLDLTSPLGMDSTALHSEFVVGERLVRGWHLVLNEYKPVRSAFQLHFAAGGAISSADDLVTFASGLLDGQVLGDPFWDLAQGQSGSVFGMPFWTARIAGREVRVASMHGSQPGQTCRLWLVDEPAMIAVVLDNSDSRAVYEGAVGIALIESVLTGEPAVTGSYGTLREILAALSEGTVADVAGRYTVLVDAGRDPVNAGQLEFESLVLRATGYPAAAARVTLLSESIFGVDE